MFQLPGIPTGCGVVVGFVVVGVVVVGVVVVGVVVVVVGVVLVGVVVVVVVVRVGRFLRIEIGLCLDSRVLRRCLRPRMVHMLVVTLMHRALGRGAYAAHFAGGPYARHSWAGARALPSAARASS